ncbi:MAG TPA: biopolymer transporter ExbD [Kofleriaceae bacterium]|nr:biopolymer transporter ExbD [Kofleriaceae bacterium]
MAGRSTVYRDGDQEIISEINVTPLVDVVLVLLVIFMITAPILAARGILVNAPTTVSGDSVSTPLQMALRRMPGGAIQVYVNGREQAGFDAARAELTRAHAADPEIKAVIAADTDIPYGEVMKAIDQVKRAGIQKFALASKRPQESDAR